MSKKRTLESWMITSGKIGDSFYSEKNDNHLTAIATHCNRKIITERVVVVGGTKETPTANTLVKVTLSTFIK